MRGQRKSLVKDQSGMVAFVVTSFIIIMMSLLVLAFSQSTRREQRQALDRQLSTQAYYTAESAINETIKYISGLPPGVQMEKNNCDPLTGADANKLKSQDTQEIFKYTCIMWDRDPEKLTFQNLNDQGKIVSLQTSSGDLESINITWEDPSGGNISPSCTGGNSFPPASGAGAYSCALGMIRVSIFPFTGDRASLIDSTYTAFFRPNNSAVGGLASFYRHASGASTQGQVVSASCNGKTCKATINDLPLGKNFLFVKSIYKPSNVEIDGVLRFTGGAGVAQFSEGQIEVDATARANDVLKRTKVSVPNNQYDRPGYSSEVMAGICKELDTYPASFHTNCSTAY